jgi:cbb3-type cytochrome c oxidase subunit III
MLRYFFLSFILAAFMVIALAGWRGQHSAKPPLEIFPDMDHQPKFQPQHPSAFYSDGRAARAPVPGTVPIGYVLPGAYLQNAASNSKAVKAPSGFTVLHANYYQTGIIDGSYGDGFPPEVEITLDLMKRGHERFNIFCAPCHSEVGDGEGIVKKFPGFPTIANLQQELIRKMPDGQLFNRITLGKGLMGGYGGVIPVEDRWAIIAYLRALQRSQNGKGDDVPAERRAELEKPAAPQPEKK